MHRSQYIRLLLSAHPPDPLPAISYANANLRPFYTEHGPEFKRLMTCIAFLPLSKLQNSIYRDLALPTLHFDLEPLFAKEYCANLGMSRQLPLRVVGDIGGGGAMARIERGRKVMGDRNGEWRQMDELPVRLEVSIRNADNYTINFFSRLKSYCLLRTDIIRYLPVLFPRNNPQSRILQ